MTGERRQLAFQKKTGKVRKPSTPETADEYLEAGVHLEEAGEKWRAGDAAKSLRFFMKAVENYETGLLFFPKSFDLAYNKARLQYGVAQQPRLYQQLQTPVIELLKQAAESHKHALKLDKNDADMLFNIAQLSSSLAEAVLDDLDDVRYTRAEASNLLYESLEYFETCLEVQEGRFTQTSLPTFAHYHHDNFNAETNAEVQTAEEEVWASIIEPVTPEALLQTCLAQLNNLKTLCDIQSSDYADKLSSIERIYIDKLREKIDLYSQSPEGRKDATLAKAAFLCAYAGARYRLFQTSISTYDAEFRTATLDAESLYQEVGDAIIAITIADAHIELNSNAEEHLHQFQEVQTGTLDLSDMNAVRWKHITRALDLYTLATQAFHVPNLAQIHIKRGDCELLRMRLGEDPFKYKLAETNQAILIRNASIYYGAAKKFLLQNQASNDNQDTRNELELKMGLTSFWRGSDHAEIAQLLRTSAMEADEAYLCLEEMKEQGLLSEIRRKTFQDIFAETSL